MAIPVEDIVMELVVNGGDARSKAIEAVIAASKGDYALAEEKMRQSSEAVNRAHEFQTSFLQKDAASEVKEEVTLIMVHGQDHLMNAMTVRDLAELLIELYKKINDKETGK